ncbi:MAG: hypothetical protein R3C45_05600 [Phycisphaerales bacterium]
MRPFFDTVRVEVSDTRSHARRACKHNINLHLSSTAKPSASASMN